MAYSTDQNSKTSSIPPHRTAELFVWGTWFLMLVIAFLCLLAIGRNIPLAEDWTMVAPLTGNEPDFWGWLWSQNNEHRVPLPRLFLLGLLKISHGDFRAGMVFNVVVLALLAAAMMQVARFLRGGQTRWIDAFLPILLLHIGDWPNLFWAWQLSLVLPIVLLCSIFLVLVVQPTLPQFGIAIVTGFGVVALPLCGAIGLLYVPLLSIWLIYCGVRHWRSNQASGKSKPLGFYLISTAIVTVAITGLYFVGYERPAWNPASPSIFATLKTAAKFLALGLGPAVEPIWALAVLVTFGFLLPTLVIAVQATQQTGQKRDRAWWVFLFLINTLLVALIIGWGRAGLVPSVGLPSRYVVLALPFFVVVFYTWQLYGKAYKPLVHHILLITVLLLLPLNMIKGYVGWGVWYDQGMQAVEQDLAAGTPFATIATRHHEFLIHWWKPEQLETHMQMLKQAEIGSFSQHTVH